MNVPRRAVVFAVIAAATFYEASRLLPTAVSASALPYSADGSIGVYVDNGSVPTELDVRTGSVDSLPLEDVRVLMTPSAAETTVHFVVVLSGSARLNETMFALRDDDSLHGFTATFDAVDSSGLGGDGPVSALFGSAVLSGRDPIDVAGFASVAASPWAVTSAATRIAVLPTIGDDALYSKVSFDPPAPTGLWVPPSNLTVHLEDQDVRPATYRIDSVDPTTSSPGRLTWEANGKIQASYEVTSHVDEQQIQDNTLRAGVLFGIGGSASIVSLQEFLMWAERRRRNRPPPGREEPRRTQQPPRSPLHSPPKSRRRRRLRRRPSGGRGRALGTTRW